MATDGSRQVIQVENLRKEYGSTIAVDGISFDVRENEIFGLLGPNGAGKTVTVEMLQGLRTPTAGSATLLGVAIDDDPYEIKSRIGVVPQSFHTFERLTVRENVALMHDMYDDPLNVDDIIDRLDLEEYADEPFNTLSGGWQRRTGIAMALVGNPEILFLDEPTAGLDPAARRDMWEQIEALPERGTTVLLTSHYMDEVEALADRVALLMDGQIVAVDTVPGLIETYGGDVKIIVDLDRASEGETADIEEKLREVADDVHWSEENTVIGRFAERLRAQRAYGDLHDIAPQLTIELVSAGMEDVFLELAGSSLGPTGELQ